MIATSRSVMRANACACTRAKLCDPSHHHIRYCFPASDAPCPSPPSTPFTPARSFGYPRGSKSTNRVDFPGGYAAYCMCEWRAEPKIIQHSPSPFGRHRARSEVMPRRRTVQYRTGLDPARLDARWIRQCPNRTGLWLRANITSMWLRHPPTIGTCVA